MRSILPLALLLSLTAPVLAQMGGAEEMMPGDAGVPAPVPALVPALIPVAVPSAVPLAVAAVLDGEGRKVGEATILQDGDAMMLNLTAEGLAPGAHAMHLHMVGRCDPADKFDSAGPHLASPGRMHGRKQAQARPHEGDLPDISVDADGKVETTVPLHEVALNPVGPDADAAKVAILDADGTALVVHATSDDQTSQPGGNAGARLLCAAFNSATTVAPGEATDEVVPNEVTPLPAEITP